MKIDWKKEISFPKLRKPSMPGRLSMGRMPSAPRLGRGSAPAVKAPKFLADLYVDLRDRHLLPLVAVLIAAIIAAPIVLGGGGGGETEPDATLRSASGGEATASAFTVVPAEPALRSPSKRLAHRKALDPFRPAGGSGGGGGSEVGSVAAGGSGSGGSASSTSGGSQASSASSGAAGGSTGVETSGSETAQVETSPVETAPGESTPAESESSSGEGSAGSEGSTTTESSGIVQHEVVTYTISIQAGSLPGKLKERTGVEPMTKLPSAKHPVVLFVGLSKNHRRALFLMTSRVTGYYGAAHCAIDKRACQMVEVTPGRSASFSIGYGKGAARFRIEVRKIERVVGSGRRASRQGARSRSAATRPAIGPARRVGR